MMSIRQVCKGSGLTVLALLTVITLTAPSAGRAAPEAGDVRAGHHLAELWCSVCHAVGPARRRGAITGAAAFSAIAAMKSTTVPGLHSFLEAPHGRMPDLHLSRGETADLTAYIISLRRLPRR